MDEPFPQSPHRLPRPHLQLAVEWGAGDSPLQRVDALTISDDATTVAAGSEVDVVVWSVTTGELTWRFECPSGVSDLRFHPSGASLFACDRAGAIFEWDLASGSERASHPAPGGGARDRWRLAVSPDGERLARYAATAPEFTPTRIAYGTRVATLRALAVAYEADGARISVELGRNDERAWEQIIRTRDRGEPEVVTTRALPSKGTQRLCSIAEDAARVFFGTVDPQDAAWRAVPVEVILVAEPGRGANQTPDYAHLPLWAGPRRVTTIARDGSALVRSPHGHRDYDTTEVINAEGAPIATLALARTDLALAVALTDGGMRVYIEADFENTVATLPRATDLRPWTTVLRRQTSARAKAMSQALLVGYIEGKFTAERWEMLTGEKPATPWAIDAAVCALWDALVEAGFAERSLDFTLGAGAGHLRRWAWQPRWARGFASVDGHPRLNERGIEEAVAVLLEPGMPRREALAKLVAHVARDGCHAALGDVERFRHACAVAGTWGARIGTVLQSAQVDYLLRVARYATPRRVTRDEAVQTVKDLHVCDEPEGTVTVAEAGGTWVSTLDDWPDARRVTIDRVTGAIRVQHSP